MQLALPLTLLLFHILYEENDHLYVIGYYRYYCKCSHIHVHDHLLHSFVMMSVCHCYRAMIFWLDHFFSTICREFNE